jgi:hypothetical protein
MAVRWNFEIVDYRPGRCEPGTEIDSFIDRGSGRFEARLPRGLRVRLLCRDKALREWEARVTAQSPSERIDVVLAPASLTRRLTLVPEGGVIEAVRVTTFEDARNLAEMAVALVEDAGEVSLLVPTDPCAVFVQAASGEVATLREGAGTEDARVMVTFRGIRSVEFVIVDVEGRPIPDVLLHVRERQGTLATGAVLSPLEVHQLEQVRSRLGWMQKVYTGGNQRTVALTRDGRARVRLPLGLYAVEVRTLPWRGSVLPVYPLREGGMFQVLPGASDVGVKVVTDRPRRLTFELVTDATERIPEVWSLRHVASGKARKFRGRMCTVWAPEGRSKWEVRSGRSLLGSVEVPEAPRTWSGRVRILP